MTGGFGTGTLRSIAEQGVTAPEEVGDVALFDTRAFLVCYFLRELAKSAGDGGAVAERRAPQWSFTESIGTFPGMEFEGPPLDHARKVGRHVDHVDDLPYGLTTGEITQIGPA